MSHVLPDHVDLYFDGSCHPVNPGGTAAYGWHLDDPETKETLERGRGVAFAAGHALATNNSAEWAGLIFALRHLNTVGWRGYLRIYGDSQLVVYQLTGRWKAKKEHLRRFRDEARRLLDGVDWSAHWIPRAQNDRADQLSRDRRNPK